MRFLTNFLFSFSTITLISGKSIETLFQTEVAKFNYPEARRDDVVDNYYGFNISDPYRWLEDSKSKESENFLKAQNSLTDSYLNSSSSVKESIKNRLKELKESITHLSFPERHGDKYYFVKDEVLYVQETLESNESKVLFDFQIFRTDNETSLRPATKFSEDGSVLAFTFSEERFNKTLIRSDVHFLNTKTGEIFSDTLEQVQFFRIVWTHDNLGIFYNLCSKENSLRTIEKDVKVYYHRIGTSQSEDIVVVEFPEKSPQYIFIDVSDCGRWLFVTSRIAGKTSLYFTELKEKINGKFNLTKITDDTNLHYIGNDGTKAIFVKYADTPRGKIVAIDLLNYKEANWTTLVPEEPDKSIREVTIVDDDKFVIQYGCSGPSVPHDTDYILQLHSLKSGKLIKKLEVGIGIIGATSNGNRKQSEYMFSFTSFLIPNTIYRVNVKTFDKLEVYRESNVGNFDSSLYEVFRVVYPSKDGTQVPMTIVMRKGAKLDGSMPALLSTHEGIQISYLPTFRYENVIFTQNFNGILAQPHVRGRVETSDEWLEDGIFQNRRKVIDDIQSAAEYLIKKGYTSREKLIIKGDGNGGPVIVSCINERPDLFGAAVVVDGIYDVLRFHEITANEDSKSTIGHFDDEENFENVIKISPLHTVKAPINNEQYPATLLLANDYNKNMKYMSIRIQLSLKYIATLQYEIGKLKQQKNPIMFQSISNSGLRLMRNTAALTFIIESLNLEVNF